MLSGSMTDLIDLLTSLRPTIQLLTLLSVGPTRPSLYIYIPHQLLRTSPTPDMSLSAAAKSARAMTFTWDESFIPRCRQSCPASILWRCRLFIYLPRELITPDWTPTRGIFGQSSRTLVCVPDEASRKSTKAGDKTGFRHIDLHPDVLLSERGAGLI